MLLIIKNLEELIKKEVPLAGKQSNLLILFFIAILFFNEDLDFEYEEDQDEIIIEMLLTLFSDDEIERVLRKVEKQLSMDRAFLFHLATEELLARDLIIEKNNFLVSKLISTEDIYDFIIKNIKKKEGINEKKD